MCHTEPLRNAGPDSRQQAKYGQVNTFLWFQFTPAQVAAWYNERHDTDDFLTFDRHGMANASEIGRPEHTPSVASTKDRKRFTDFGASARREDGRPDGGDVLELAARIDGDKAEVMSQAAKEMVREARKVLESAARSGIQPPAWVQAIMSQAGHEHFNHLAQKHGHQVQVCTIQSPDYDQEHTRGVVGFSTGTLQELETIRDYGQAHEWAALVINGEEMIPAGRSNWLDFVWLSQKKDQQRQVYECIRGRNQCE
jgi:hypothetical protein